MSNFYSASDYAGVSGGRFSFYFGYEETHFDEWCFVVKEDGKEVLRIPQSKLGCKDRWNVAENLLAGIGQWLERPSEAPREGATPRTKAQCLTAVVKELGLDTTDPFTRVLAAAFALQDAYDESRAALTRCQQIVHEQAAPGRSEGKE